MAKKVGIDIELKGNFTSSMKKLGTTSGTALKGVRKSADKATSALKKMGGSIFSLKGLIAGVGVTLLVRKLTSLTLAQANLQDETIKTSRAIGVEVETLTSLRRSAELGGTSIESLDNGIKRLSRNIFDASTGTGEAIKAFDELGVEVTDAEGNLRSVDDVILDISDSFAKLEDGTLKNAQAQLLFGKSGGELINTLNQGSQALRNQRLEAEKLGIIFDDEQAEQAEKFNDAITDLGNSFDGAFRAVTQDLLPKLTPLIQDLTDDISNNRESFREFGNILFDSFNTALPVLKSAGTLIADATRGVNNYVRANVGRKDKEIFQALKQQVSIERELFESREKNSDSEFAVLSVEEYLTKLGEVQKKIANLKKEREPFQKFLNPEVDDGSSDDEKIKRKEERDKEYLARKEQREKEANQRKIDRDNEQAEIENTRLEELEIKRNAIFLLAGEKLRKEKASRRVQDAIDAKKVSDDLARQEIKNENAIADASLTLGKEVFGQNKLFTIADIGLSTSRGIMSALATTPPNPILAGIIGATGAVQIAKANSQKYADGGFVSGAGTGRSDSIPASLSNGEFVVNASATSDNRELLEAINNGGGGATQNITINAGAGTDIDALAQAVTNAVSRANQLRLEPQI